ncbi:MAG: DUF4124 domain-containing protein [Pseudomonadota bacterium]|nr:DUF4124 domain-containing protein [Pseudomonadota bacterium]
MRILLILAGLTLSLAAVSQEIWRWVDRDGIVHYADQPGAPDAKLISVIDPNSYEGDPETATYQSSSGNPDDPAGPMYESLTIVQPSAEQVFFGGDTVVRVEAALDGSMQTGHTLAFYVNGNRRPATSGFGLELRNLPRGTYVVQASVVDANGTALITSDQSAFHVRQPSINSPQSPQARPRPPATPPRPTPTPAPAPRPAPVPGPGN